LASAPKKRKKKKETQRKPARKVEKRPTRGKPQQKTRPKPTTNGRRKKSKAYQKRSNAAKKGWVSRRSKARREEGTSGAVVLPDEILKVKVLSLYDQFVGEEKILPLGRADSAWIEITSDDRQSISQSIFIGELLDEGNVDTIVEMVEETAELIRQQTPDFLFMASIRMFEYGDKIVGSPTGTMFEDDEGIFSETWQGIPAVPFETFMVRLSMKLEAMVDAQESSAALIESIVVRAIEPKGK